jgi:hypothetical protein
MDINLPILAYYPKDNSKFVDPMYVPYERRKVPIDNEGCYVTLNNTQKMGNPNYVHPDHYRLDWNWDFLRLYPNDPCPGGWRDAGNGFCTRVKDEFHESSFYTKDQFEVQYQYRNGYTVDLRNHHNVKNLNRKYGKADLTFDAASVNPQTGAYVTYFEPKNKYTKSNKYGGLPSRLSYMGI